MDEIGLRERQKLVRRQAVLEAARQLFELDGFEATTIEDVARAALVSPGTIYNYFGTKNNLLVEVFEQEWRQAEEALQRLPRRPSDDAVASITRLVEAYNRFDERFGTPRLWRQLLAATYGGSAELRTAYQRISDQFKILLVDRLRVLAQDGRLRPDAEVEITASILSAIADATFHRDVRVRDRWPARPSADLRDQIRLALASSVPVRGVSRDA